MYNGIRYIYQFEIQELKYLGNHFKKAKNYDHKLNV